MSSPRKAESVHAVALLQIPQGTFRRNHSTGDIAQDMLQSKNIADIQIRPICSSLYVICFQQEARLHSVPIERDWQARTGSLMRFPTLLLFHGITFVFFG